MLSKAPGHPFEVSWDTSGGAEAPKVHDLVRRFMGSATAARCSYCTKTLQITQPKCNNYLKLFGKYVYIYMYVITW